jgi:polyferredoxin
MISLFFLNFFLVSLFEDFVVRLFFFWFCFLFLSFVFVCVLSYVCGAMEEEDMSNKKREKRDKKEEQHEERLEEVSLLQSSPCKPTMVAEVEVCCLHQNFLIFFT